MFIKDNEAILGKIEELCAVVLEQEEYEELRSAIDRFEKDEEANAQYERYASVKRLKEEKEALGLALPAEESEAFEREEMAVYANEVIRKYLFAQKEFGHLQDILNDYFTKTVDYGRLPESKELKRIIRGCGSHRT